MSSCQEFLKYMIEVDPDNNLITRTLGNKFRKFFTRVVRQ